MAWDEARPSWTMTVIGGAGCDGADVSRAARTRPQSEPSNNAETADEDFVDGLDAGALDADVLAALRIGPACDVARREESGHARFEIGVHDHSAVKPKGRPFPQVRSAGARQCRRSRDRHRGGHH